MDRRPQTRIRMTAVPSQTSVVETQADAAKCKTIATGSANNKASAMFAS
jgi:hypothetical protein